MAKKAKKKKNSARPKAKRPAKKNTTKKRPAKRPNTAKHSKKKKAARRPNPTNVLRQKIAGMKPGVWYDSTMSGAKVRIKRVGQGFVTRPKAKRK